MNKEFREFLEDEIYEIKEMSEDVRYGYEAGVYDSNTYLLKKYDEFHKPVVVPDFVADWIKETKEKGYPLAYAINCSKGELGKWLHECGTDVETEQNQELFAEAWLEGYTVEEEQRYYAKLKEIKPLEKEWLTNLSGPNYYAIDTKGLMLGEFILDLVGMKTQASAYTLKDWERHGINGSNADFVRVEELEK